MNRVMTTSRQAKRMAGFAALVATLFTTAGTLTLADHYAHTGEAGRNDMAAAARQAAPAAGRLAETGQSAIQS